MSRAARWGALALSAAVLLRLAGIEWGLPRTYNADEPHLVNLAVSFGGGSLRPYAFKYPTLWPYVLFLFYGLYFLVWSAAGFRHGLAEFAGLYAWNPGGFYLIGRLLASACSLLAAGVVWRMERESRGRDSLPWAALLIAFAPVIVELAHSCKPDCLMLLFASAAWYCALRLCREGGRGWHRACGVFIGLSLSTQYTALPVALLLPLAHWLGPKPRRPGWLVEGLALLGLAFLAGTPYALIDGRRFLADLRDFSALARLRELHRWEMAKTVLANLWNFAGTGSIAGAAALLGLARLASKDRRLALLASAPLFAYVMALSSNTDGGWMRYLLGGFPGLALLSAEGLSWLDRPRRPLWTALLAAAVFVPGLASTVSLDREMRLPDTRAAARDWIKDNVPPGSSLLLDVAHASPWVLMSREEAEELYRKTAAAGSPRSRLYRAMVETHPGGGYRFYRIRRSAKDLWSNPRLVSQSEAESATLDVRPGLDPVRAARVDYVVLTGAGADPKKAPELTSFFEELAREGELVKVFAPRLGAVAGPLLRIYRVKRGPA